MLSKEDLLTRKKELLEKNACIQAEFTSTSNEMSSASDSVDEAEVNLEKEAILIRERCVNNELVQVNNAIKAMDSDIYGICSHCYEEIDVDRMKLRPYSTSCVTCLNAEELKIKQKTGVKTH